MMPQGPLGVVRTRHPLVPPDVPVGPILVSGWTGWVDGSTLHAQDHCLEGIEHQQLWGHLPAAPIPPNRLQDSSGA